jgi:hypothetical protein
MLATGIIHRFALIGCCVLFLSCATSNTIEAETKRAQTSNPPSEQPPHHKSTSISTFKGIKKVMILGGEGRRDYLGCLNCDLTSYDSIFNELGPYGPGSGYEFTADTLYSRGFMKKYGNTGFQSNLSACNWQATNPPVIVDEGGGYYGRLSVAVVSGHGDSVCKISSPNYNLCEIVKKVCEE